MTDTITSPSFPKGIGPLRSEAEARSERHRYCEDCRFYSLPEPGKFGDARCTRPRAMQALELVAREAKKPDAFCDLQRSGYGQNDCGKEAKFFQPKTETADA